jgi:predicted transcriptional regulator
MWSIEMTDKATTATSLRMPDGLLRQLTKAAHKCEMSRTAYITAALQEAVTKTLEQKK